jgi:polysaccharide biosynthesis/export protein
MKWMNNWLRGLFVMCLMMAGLAHAVESDYVLGPGDVININVYQSPDMTVQTRVSDSGSITFPLLGTVKVGGLTVREAEGKLAVGLKDGGFLKNPQISIVVAEVKGNLVSVLGAVNRPGRYPLELTNTKLSQVLAQAGGSMVGSASDMVVLMGTRGGKSIRKEIDFPMIFSAGTPAEDPVLQNGDIVYVDRAPFVYVYGEVQSPGMRALQRDMTVMQVLAASAGLNLRGTLKGMTISRRDPATGKTTVIQQPDMNDRVQKDDVIFVKESLF